MEGKVKSNFPNKYNVTRHYDLPSRGSNFRPKSKACRIDAHNACLGKSHKGRCYCVCHGQTNRSVKE